MERKEKEKALRLLDSERKEKEDAIKKVKLLEEELKKYQQKEPK
jgi:GTPase involved in cell partitioning and DNA repair